MELSKTKDFKNIVLKNEKLIDVRAPIEYEKGAIPNSINLPILNNEERHIIGICYKEKGNSEATKLGYKMISGNLKEDRVNSWCRYFEENPRAMIYCFRGGSRSTIAQQWIYEATGKDMIKLDGGYKEFRSYLIEALLPSNIEAKPIILSGYTGSGKTILLNKLSNSIDLEGIANHRGSTFGHYTTPQPTQINFENDLAYKLIKHNENLNKYMILEDEGKNIGRSFIPKEFYNFMQNGDVIFLEATLEDRVENILQEYVIKGQEEFKDLEKWFADMLASIQRVKSKLGGNRLKILINELTTAYNIQVNTGNIDKHRNWIEIFLREYYDPMYKHGMDRSNKNIIFKGTEKEVIDYVNEIEGIR